eukprot:7108909-Prymnesium_polylepis.3
MEGLPQIPPGGVQRKYTTNSFYEDNNEVRACSGSPRPLPRARIYTARAGSTVSSEAASGAVRTACTGSPAARGDRPTEAQGALAWRQPDVAARGCAGGGCRDAQAGLLDCRRHRRRADH